ncbi:MAG: ribonuclease P protein component [Henriciella sp.]|uniref:ribonuclease P protein component n=1 Tax=Henriciella sp. TaxID=1968823 RepID=UPI003C73A2DE
MADTKNTGIEVVRLTVRPQFLFVRAGVSERRKSLVVQARMATGERAHPHAIGEGFTATKKIGNAVIRNRAKRRLKEAARQLLAEFGVPGADYVFIARMDTAEIGWQRLLDDMESALISLAATLKRGSGEGPDPVPNSTDHGPTT